MAKMNQTVKEILQIVIFLIVVGIIVTVAVIYPLNRAKAYMARPDADDFDTDSLQLNDPTPFIEAGLAADTFRIDADGLTHLAAVEITPQPDSATPDQPVEIRGTAILLHDERESRDSMIPLAGKLVELGYRVEVYDQRASGLSTGKYHGEGQYEASDLIELISYLDIRDRLTHPVAVIGRSLGAEAGLLAAQDEGRIDAMVAIEPYMTTQRMIDMYRAEHDAFWIPFFRSLFWWWYEMRSSYAAPYRTMDDIEGVGCRTLILADETSLSEPEFERLKEVSDPGMLQTAVLIDDEQTLHETIMKFLLLSGQQEVNP